MNAKWISLLALAALVAGGAAYLMPRETPAQPSVAAEAADDDGLITLAEAPDAVRAAMAKIVSPDAVKRVTRLEDEDDLGTYDVIYSAGGVEHSKTFSAAGDLIEDRCEITADGLPAAAAAALKKAFGDSTFGKRTAVQNFTYDVEVIRNGKSRHVTVDASGQIEDNEDDADRP